MAVDPGGPLPVIVAFVGTFAIPLKLGDGPSLEDVGGVVGWGIVGRKECHYSVGLHQAGVERAEGLVVDVVAGPGWAV